jgi:phosphonate degradation associated HDIG domain protein
VTKKREEIVAEILRMFAEHGDSEYGGEEVTQREHALQAAHFAKKSGSSASLITAALLHDVGHLLHDLPADAPERGVDDRHEELASNWLAHWFGPEVVEPVRLHVDAKRYLCAVESSYFNRLSEPSIVSLGLQGGPMSEAEIAAFRSNPHWEAAVLLRRWDDTAKDPLLVVSPVESYAPTIEEALNRSMSEGLNS